MLNEIKVREIKANLVETCFWIYEINVKERVTLNKQNLLRQKEKS